MQLNCLLNQCCCLVDGGMLARGCDGLRELFEMFGIVAPSAKLLIGRGTVAMSVTAARAGVSALPFFVGVQLRPGHPCRTARASSYWLGRLESSDATSIHHHADETQDVPSPFSLRFKRQKFHCCLGPIPKQVVSASSSDRVLSAKLQAILRRSYFGKTPSCPRFPHKGALLCA